jgi:DNA-binding NtrC family response regulator
MNSFKIFVVEDDKLYGKALNYYLSLNPDNEVYWFQTGTECLENLNKYPSLVSLDYKLPDIKGSEVLKKIKEYNPNIPVIIVSGQEDINTAVNLLKEGAYDYFPKDKHTKERLWNSVKNIKKSLGQKHNILDPEEVNNKKFDHEEVIKGNSSHIKNLYKFIEKASKTNISVSLFGETGTGKDLVAKAIHYNSNRKNHPFIALNVSAIPKELIESELFGYEKGAFTGANDRKIGKFELANKGTIFLDEIAEMDLNMQSKLLRVIQEKELTRIGGNETINFDIRIIVATNKTLTEEVRMGNFREDLYYRLLGLPIEIPPLRNRGNDILLLARYFLSKFCKENNLKTKNISKGAKEKLMMYSYPGNVRELKAIIELSAVLSNNGAIEKKDISFNSADITDNLLNKEDTLRGYIQKIITYYMQKYHDNVPLVADKLSMGKSTIYRILKNQEV